MIYIRFEVPTDKSWINWHKKCQEKQELLNESYNCGQPDDIAESLYKQQKKYFLGLDSPFYGKCAYCETLIAESHPGDLDHYRPKKSVTDLLTKVEIIDDTGKSFFHPGYYWLAYDYKNLLPSCEDCNRPNKVKTKGIRIGKWDTFPVKSFRACKPGEEINEEPLIINPTIETNIENHFEINSTGIISYFTEEGEVTCKVFGLNLRESLISRRLETYWQAYDATILALFCELMTRNISDSSRQLSSLKDYQAGVKPFSAAGRAGINAALRELKNHSDELRNQIK